MPNRSTVKARPNTNRVPDEVSLPLIVLLQSLVEGGKLRHGILLDVGLSHFLLQEVQGKAGRVIQRSGIKGDV